MSNLIENYLSKSQDSDDELIKFVDSAEFDRFKLIMERLYVEKLAAFHQDKPEKLESDRAVLGVYLNLGNVLEYQKNVIIKNRKDSKEKTLE